MKVHRIAAMLLAAAGLGGLAHRRRRGRRRPGTADMRRSPIRTVGLVGTMLLAAIVPWARDAQGAILYTNDFEMPAGFIDTTGVDVSQQTVSSLYSFAGFSFQQTHTVETLEINGGTAFGSGYSDPSGIGGNYALGMLRSAENDLLSLTFDVGSFDFLNFGLTISSIDLDGVGGPFGPEEGVAPVFRFELFDSPGGVFNITSPGTLLSSFEATGTASPRAVFEWTEVVAPLSTAGNTDGHISLRIDLVGGSPYAAMDNFRIVASNTSGDLDLSVIPEPSTLTLLAIASLGGLARAFCKSRRWRLSRCTR